MKTLDSNGLLYVWGKVKALVAGIVVPTKTSDLTNDSNFVQAATTLAGYGITDAMTAAQITTAINQAIAGVTGISFEVVQTLPAVGSTGTIYLVPNSGSGQNIYDEYIYYNSSWEKIGSTNVDLSQYWSKSELVAITNNEIDTICT